MLTRIIGILARFLALIGAICLFSVMVLVGADVFMRYVFTAPIPGTLELSEFVIPIVTFSCFAYVAMQSRHIRATFLVERLHSPYRFVAEFFLILLMLLFLSLLIWRTSIQGWRSLQILEISVGILPVPKFPIRLLIPIGLSLGWLYFLRDLLLLISKRRLERK